MIYTLTYRAPGQEPMQVDLCGHSLAEAENEATLTHSIPRAHWCFMRLPDWRYHDYDESLCRDAKVGGA